MSNIMINNLNLRDYKNYKIIFNYNIIKNCLKNNNFLLFFYYDFLNSETRISLKKNLNDNNLKIIILKKNSLLTFLSNKKFKFLKNILNNNIILIYNKNNEIINPSIINKLIQNNNLKLIGCLWNKKFYRPSKIKKLTTLNKNNKINLFLTLKQKLNFIKFNFSNLKKNTLK